jgi:hypothetical protein
MLTIILKFYNWVTAENSFTLKGEQFSRATKECIVL